jgi:hypothetical protein
MIPFAVVFAALGWEKATSAGKDKEESRQQ